MATVSVAATKRYATLKVKQATGPLTQKEAGELDTITLALARPAKKKPAAPAKKASPKKAARTPPPRQSTTAARNTKAPKVGKKPA